MTGLRRMLAALAPAVLLLACTSDEQANTDDACPQPDVPAVAGAGPPVLPDPDGAPAPRAYTVEVVDRMEHDITAFTQGLVHADGLLYESTGLYGESDLRLVQPATGEVLLDAAIEEQFFGEGLAMHDGRLFQLTWQEQQLFVWDRCTLDELDRMDYTGEGWGLASDGEVLWRTDGSSLLHRHDPDTFKVIDTVEVSDRGVALARLNELELIDGQIMANVLGEPWIAVIDQENGQVTGWVDGTPLVDEVRATDHNDVLNGIAVDPETGRLWLTGKRWPTLFEVRIVPGDDLPPPGLL
ncbi:MAG TPA: glutaminyl-peptide cyclotransferase [Jiangellaceae bacterium]